MKIFLDSVNFPEISKYASYGILDGVTTNPTLVASSSMEFSEIISKLHSTIKGDISIEVAAEDYETMIKEGEKILAIASDSVIKLPITWDGIKACNYFAKKNVKVNMTLCFSVNQALLVAKAGAAYVSPFIGRLEEIGEDGIGLIADIRSVYDNYGLKTEILAASVRTLEHVEQSALCGADAITMPVRILSTLIEHDLTSSGIKKFSEDWIKSGKKL